MAWIERNGQRFYYATGGKEWQDGQPALVFVHGAGCEQSVWKFQSRALAHAGWNVMSLDLPGHGRSDDIAEISSIEDFAEWVHEMVQLAGIGPAALAGHSMGACIAMTYAATHPEHVTALALVGSALSIPVNDQLLNDSLNNKREAVAFITGYGLDRNYRIGAGPAPGIWVAGGIAAMMMRCPEKVLHRDYVVSGSWDGSGYAGKVKAPALILTGETDRLTPAKMGFAVAEAITGARHELLPGAGHMMPAEMPRKVMKSMRHFLGALRERAA